MPIDGTLAGCTAEPTERTWEPTDCLLYALGIGAGSVDPGRLELDLTTENSDGVDQRVPPTFATVVGVGGGLALPPGAVDPAQVVHGEQEIELFGPIPTAGAVRTTTTVTGVYDKGSGALIELEAVSVDVRTNAPRFTTRTGVFVRGAGGFGGDRGPGTAPGPLPRRQPDEVVTYQTREDQALLYRLSGDRNPLHSDPTFARRAGFDRPILHGLCTYGFAGRALLHTWCGSDPARFRSMRGRFTRPTYPGDTLTTAMWTEGDAVRFRTDNQRGETVLDAGRFVHT